VLAEITRGETYGYAILKDTYLSKHLSISGLYHILTRLEGANCVSVRTSEHEGRLRKMYSITKIGRARLSSLTDDLREAAEIFRHIEEVCGNDQD